eukprot:Pgem_evm1s9032
MLILINTITNYNNSRPTKMSRTTEDELIDAAIDSLAGLSIKSKPKPKQSKKKTTAHDDYINSCLDTYLPQFKLVEGFYYSFTPSGPYKPLDRVLILTSLDLQR